MIDVLITHNTTIRFEGPRDRWVVERLRDGQVEQRVEIPLIEMADEYDGWKRAGSPGEWREHAESFCLKRLQEATLPPLSTGDGNAR